MRAIGSRAKGAHGLIAVVVLVWMAVAWAAPRAQQGSAAPATSSPAPARQTSGTPAVAAAATPQAAAPASHRALVDQYCVTCHNQRLKTGGLALDTLDMGSIEPDAAVWEKVIRKVRGNQMPPAGMPRPDPATMVSFVRSLESTLDRAAMERPNPGRALLHRFNRAEYANAIRDLLAVDVDATVLLPPDDSSYGFDNIADVLGMSPLLMERYVAAAERISALAVGDMSMPVSAEMYRLKMDHTQMNQIAGLPPGTRGGTLVRHTFPLDGEYVVKVKLWKTSVGFVKGLQTEHELEISIDGERVFLAPVGGRSDYQMNVLTSGAGIEAVLDARLRQRLKVTAGPHDVGVTFLAIAGGNRTGPEGLRPTLFQQDPLYIHGMPSIESFTIEGPYNATSPGDTPSRRAIFTCRPAAAADDVCARSILGRLARKAYRRPVTEADLQVLLGLYKEGRTDGGFERGIQMALQGLLTSPHFLFRAQRDPANLAAGAVHRISDLELASRLSFFLWSSLPDEPLLALAERGQLRQPAILEREVRRMLADERAEALVKNFGGQWLHLRNLEAFVPDRVEFPEFDGILKDAMRRETELFLESVIREDRSALDLLRADYTFVNEPLARHYGIRGVYGNEFQRVAIQNPVRRGLLGHASILAVTSYPNRTSPVLRGRFVLDNILGTPPAPPPPNAANVLPVTVRPTTMRERMEAHRASPACAGCHRVMDPIGLALENFDATGAWRTRDGEHAIDATDTLVDGTPVNGPVALRDALLKSPELFVSAVTEKMMTYALGRGVEHYDMPAVRRVVREAAAREYRMVDLIAGIVKSVPFQMRRKPLATEEGVGAPATQSASRTGAQ